MTTLTATVELNLALARPVIAVLRVARYVIGARLAERLLLRVGLPLVRWRVAGLTRWQWLGREVCRG